MTSDPHDLELTGHLLGVVDLDPFTNTVELLFQLDAQGDGGAARLVLANLVPPARALDDLPGTAVTADDTFVSDGESIPFTGQGQLVRDGSAEFVDVDSITFGAAPSRTSVAMTVQLSSPEVTLQVTADFDGIQVRGREHEDAAAALWDVRSYERVESDEGVLFRPQY